MGLLKILIKNMYYLFQNDNKLILLYQSYLVTTLLVGEYYF